MRYDTLLLDQTTWDLTLDAGRNIALATPGYSLAQDVASACRLFLGELRYDTTKGIPYFSEILGNLPPVSVLAEYLEKAALTVPGVVFAKAIITDKTDRTLSIVLRFIDEQGVENAVQF